MNLFIKTLLCLSLLLAVSINSLASAPSARQAISPHVNLTLTPINQDPAALGRDDDRLSPPDLSVDPQAIEEDLLTGEQVTHRILVSNDGDEDVDWNVEIEIVGERQRDRAQRSLRTTDNENGPARDDPGDILAQYDSGINECGGLAFDGDLIWGISYGQNRLAALDLDGNQVRNFQIHGQPIGIAFTGENLWIGSWNSSTLRSYDLDGQLLETFNLDFGQIAGMSYDGDQSVLMNTLNDRRIHVLRIEDRQEVAAFAFLGAAGNNDIWGICWVPDHPDGELWCNSGGRLYQVDVDDDWNVAAVQNFAWNADAAQAGPAHDGENMWHGMWNNATWFVCDDGVEELRWIALEPDEGRLAANEEAEIELILNADRLNGGDCEAELRFLANGENQDDAVIDVLLHVTGAPDIAAEWDREAGFPDLIDFNMVFPDLLTGQRYEFTITVVNDGTDLLLIDEIAVPAEIFDAQPQELQIEPGEESEVVITLFTPDDEPVESDDPLIISSNDPDEAEFAIAMNANVRRPPRISIDRNAIEDELSTGEIRDYPLTLTNEGEAPLRFETEIAVIREPERTAGQPILPTSVNIVSPTRDAPGDVLDQFQWPRAGAGRYRAGIAYNPEDNLIFLTAYSPAWMAIVDPENDFRSVRDWQPQNERPMGAAWLNNVFYTVAWSNNYLGRWDIDGNALGVLNLGFSPRSVASSPDLNVLLVGNENNSDINIVDEEARVSGTIRRANYEQFIGNQTQRSLCWVDAHRNGQLWVNTDGHIWQLKVDTDEWVVEETVVDWETGADGATEWDGLGHDGENLIYAARGVPNYVIYDDGVAESFWLMVAPEEGTMESGENFVITATFDARRIFGDYEADIIINSNDPDEPNLEISVQITVDSAPGIEATWPEGYGYPDVIDFNQFYPDLYVGTPGVLAFTIENIGTEELVVEEISTGSNFFYTEPERAVLDAGASRQVIVVFTAERRGDFNPELHIISNAGNMEDLIIPLHGRAFDPPEVVLSPEVIEDELVTGESSDHQITVRNEGEALLRFEVEIEILEEPGRDAASRSLRSTGNGTTPVRDDPGDVLAEFDCGYESTSGMAFDGELMWGCFYNSNHLVAMDREGNVRIDRQIHNNPLAMTFDGEALWIGQYSGSTIYRYNLQGELIENFDIELSEIMGLASDKVDFIYVNSGNDGRIHVLNIDDHRQVGIIDYQNVVNDEIWEIEWVNQHSEGQLWCNARGRVYQLHVDENWRARQVLNFAWNSDMEQVGPAHDGENIWHGSWNNDNWWVYDDGVHESRWLSIDRNEGVVNSGEEEAIGVTLDANRLIGGDYEASIHILSNALRNRDAEVNVFLRVNGAPVIEGEWESEYGFPDRVDWNSAYLDLFTGVEYPVTVEYHNDGTEELQIRGIFSENGAFSCAAEDLAITPGDWAEVDFLFSADEPGLYEGVMIAESNAANDQSYEIPIRAIASNPPIASLRPNEIESDLLTGETEDHVIRLTNDGGALLRWTSDREILQEPERDSDKRTLRTIDGTAPSPTRDPPGDSFVWQQAGRNRYKAGIAWDADNNLFALTTYSPNWIALMDPADDYRIIQEWRPAGNPMGCTWLNGVFYCILWSNDWIHRFDIEGNDLGNWGINFDATSIASSQDLNLIFLTDNNTRDIRVYNPEGEQFGVIDYENYGDFINGSEQRSLCWVDAHREGQLWMNTPGRLWELHVDTDEWVVDRATQSFNPNNQVNPQEWDGLGHDGEDLYYGEYGREGYVVLDDGVEESTWIDWEPKEGEVEPGDTQEIIATFDATDLLGGDYQAELTFDTNDPENPSFVVITTLHVTGVPMLDVVPHPGDEGAVEFGIGYVGYRTLLEVEVQNVGTAQLEVETIESENQAFGAVDGQLPIRLEARQSAPLTLYFDAQEAADIESNLIFVCNDPDFPDGYDYRVSGQGLNAPVLEIDPPEIEAEINLGRVENVVLELANTGGSLLEWTSDREVVQEPDLAANRYGRNDQGPRRPGRDPAGEVLAQFDSGIEGCAGLAFDGEWMWGISYTNQRLVALDMEGNRVRDIQAHQQALGIAFDGEALWIGEWTGSIIRRYDLDGELIETFDLGIRRITGMSSDMENFIYINSSNDRLIHVLNIEDREQVAVLDYRAAMNNEDIWGIAWVPEHREGQLWGNAGSRLYQALINDEGEVEAVQNFQWNADEPYSGPAHDGENMWHGSWNNAMWFICDDGIEEMRWLTWEPQEGAIEAGESMEVDVVLNTELPVGGLFEAILYFISNDPANPEIEVPVSLNGIGVPLVETDPLASPNPDAQPLAFDEVYLGQLCGINVVISNIGTDALEIEEIEAINDEEFGADVEPGTLILPREELIVALQFHPVELGRREGRVIFHSNATNVGEGENSGDFFFDVIGVGVGAPIIETIPGNEEWIRIGIIDREEGAIERPFTILNAGGVGADDLDWQISIERPDPDNERDDLERELRTVSGQASNRPQRDPPQGRGLLIQERCGWFGYEFVRHFDAIDGLDYLRIRTWDEFNNLDLAEFDFIWIGNYESEAWINQHNQNLERLEEWVDDGGVIYHSSGTNNHGTLPVNPGGLIYHYGQQQGERQQNLCPILVGPDDNWFIGYMNENDPFEFEWNVGAQLRGNDQAHGVFYQEEVDALENSNWNQAMVAGNPSNQPIALVYSFGVGFCFVTTTLDGYLHADPEDYPWGRTGEAIIHYLDQLSSSARWLSVAPMQGTIAQGDRAEPMLVIDPTGIRDDGDYFANLRITSNDPETPVAVIHIQMRVGEMPRSHFVDLFETGISHNLLVTDIEISGEQAPFGCEAGIFTPGGILAGSGVWMNRDLGISAWGDDPETERVEGFQPGQLMNLRLWDNEAEVEMDAHANVNDAELRWVINGFTEIELSGSPVHNLRIDFVEGWNLVSFNIVPPEEFWLEDEVSGPDVESLMEPLRDEEQHRVILVKDEAGRFYAPGIEFNSIPFWDLTQGYRIKVTEDLSANWSGELIPPNSEIPISVGWNLIAYFPTYRLSARAPDFRVLEPIIEHVIVAKDKVGRFILPGQMFSNMAPWREGEGYQIKVDDDLILRYPPQEDDEIRLAFDETDASSTHWAANSSTGNNMSLLLTTIEGGEIRSGDELAAFDTQDRLIGSGSATGGMIGIAVWGDDASTEFKEGPIDGETFTMKIWRNEGNELIVKAKDRKSFVYRTDDLVTFEGVLQKPAPVEFYLAAAYPNPFNSSTRISFGLATSDVARLALFDLNGRQVALLLEGRLDAGHHQAVLQGDGLASGLYILRLETSGRVFQRKVSLVK